MIDIALATKNRFNLFKKAIFNLNSQINAKEICLFIMDGGESEEVKDFLDSRRWNFNSINLWKDFQVKEVRDNPGQWTTIYNFLFKQGNSPYLSYWSDDILLKEKDSFQIAIKRMQDSKDNPGCSVFPFYSPTHGEDTYLMVSEAGIVMINFGVILRKAFEEVHGLDEKFKFLCADRDLSNRIYIKGYKTIINADRTIFHVDFKKEWRNPLSGGLKEWSARRLIQKKLRRDKDFHDLINSGSIDTLYMGSMKFKNINFNEDLKIKKINNYNIRIIIRKEDFEIMREMNKKQIKISQKDRIKKYHKKLPGTFWGITTFFNPAGYSNKYRNYKIFRKKSKKQGLSLCAVELVFGKGKFELNKNDAEILIQIRGSNKNLMWQKERLLNIALKNLPIDCDKVAWLDGDIIFENKDWIKETSKLLEDYCVLQPFSISVLLPKKKTFVNIKKISWGLNTRNKIHSRAYNLSKMDGLKIEDYAQLGHVGFAWAGRKEIFDKIGFYDSIITGSGDLFMSDAFYNSSIDYHYKPIPKKTMENYKLWRKKAFKLVKGSVFYTPGVLFHLWHGDPKNRNYYSRYFFLEEAKFNPDKDIKIGKNGLFEWASNKPKLHEDIKNYFFIRQEDVELKEKIPYQLIINEFKSKAFLKYHKTMGNIGVKLKLLNPNIYHLLKKLKDKIEFKIHR